MLWLKLGWRNLWRNRRRTIIELVTIGGSVTLGVFWNNLAVGTYDRMIDDGVKMGSGHIGIYHEKYLEERKTMQLVDAKDLVPELEAIDGVNGVYPRLSVPALARSSRESRAAGIMGLDFDRERAINPLLADKRIIEGKIPGADNKRGALVGKRLADELGLKVGNKFVVMMQDADGTIESGLLRVSGILQSNIREIDAATVIVARDYIGGLIGHKSGAHVVAIMCRSHKDIGTVLPKVAEVTDGIPGIRPYKWNKAMPELASTIQMDHGGLKVMVILLYLIVGIGTINTLLMSVLERTREFGVIRAIGLSRRNIRFMVLTEGFVLGCTGAGIGVALGSTLSWYTTTHGIDMTRFMGGEQGVGGTLFDPIMYSGWDISGMVYLGTGMIIIAILASLYPARNVMKIRPSDAMRMY